MNLNFIKKDKVVFGSPASAAGVRQVERKLIPQNFSQDYDKTPVPQKPSTVRIPVMLYHHVGPMPGSKGSRINNVTPEIFEKQLQYMQAKEYQTLSMDDYIKYLKSGKNPGQKSVLLTFDDGYIDNYTTVFPLLKKYEMVATFFIPVNRTEISEAQLREMSNAGMDIESHTMTHRSMTYIYSAKDWNYELLTSKSELERITGKPVKALAYPYCVFNNGSMKFLNQKSPYEVAFRCNNPSGNSIDNTWYRRLEIFRTWQYDSLENQKDRLSGVEYRPNDPIPDDPNGYKIKAW